MPIRPLPNDPSLEHLRKDAKRLRKALRAGDPEAIAQLREFHPRPDDAAATLSLADAQLVVARSYGFTSWTKLKQHIRDIEPFVWNPPPASHLQSSADVFITLACLTYAGWHRSNPAKAVRMLAENPEIATVNVYTAAATGDVAAVRRMIEGEPALVNKKGGPLRWEPLLYACYSRMDGTDARRSTTEVARLLLSRGADPNAGFLFSGSYAFTALTGVFGRGEDWHNQPPHPESARLARILLEAGADPNDAQTLYNRHFEANDDHLQLLLEFGLGRDNHGPWLKRLNDRRFNPGQLLVEELWSAAKNGYSERIKLLIRHGADVNAPSLRNGRTPAEEALRAGNDRIAEYLVRHGARTVDLGPLETFALACINGRRDEVRQRLGNDPDLLDRLGHHGRVELLHRALDAKNQQGIRLIVELGVDIDGMVPGTGFDRTVLHNAAGWGGLETVTLLIALGANPHLRDLTYHSAPIGWAYHHGQRDVVTHLLQYATIFDALRCDGVERVSELLRQDASLASARDESGRPLVAYLHPEMQRLEEMLQLLVSHGADPNERGTDGRTLLDRALGAGASDFADALRRYGARTSAELSGRA